MPNTFVSRSKMHARLFGLYKRITGATLVEYFESGKAQRRYHIAWV